MTTHVKLATLPTALAIAWPLATAPRVAAQDAAYTFVAGVFDGVTGRPVEAAFAAALGTDSWAVTDANGSFRLNGLTRGRHVIRVWRIGYTPTTFSVTFDSLPLNVLNAPIGLQPIPVQMPEMVVEGDRTRLVAGPLREFYRRRREERGRFYTREEIERRRADRLEDVLRDVPGVAVQSLGNLRTTIRLGAACEPVYYVDGIQSNEGLALSLRPERIEGIEVYRRPSEIPADLNTGSAACGVIVLWTRR